MNEELQNEYVDVNVHDNYPSSDEHITVPPMKVLPLKKICMTIGQLPTAYLETMTYYEMLLWFIGYLRDNIIPTVNNNGEALEEVQSIVMSLQNYINDFKDSIDQDVEDLETYMNDYFENLDVQEEINNKLDAMTENGTLMELLASYIPIIFPEMYGAVGDGESDDTEAIQEAIDTAHSTHGILNLMEKTYITTDSLIIYDGTEINGNGATIKNETNHAIITASGVVHDVHIHDLNLIGANNEAYTSNNGIQLVCYYSKFERLFISYCYSGIYLDTTGASGTLVENKFENIRCSNYYQYGIYLGAGGNNKLTDGFINTVICNGNNSSTFTGQAGLYIGSGAGYNINDVHIYGKNDRGIVIGGSYYTNISNIYIETFTEYGILLATNQMGANLSNIYIVHTSTGTTGTAIQVNDASYLPYNTHAGNLVNVRITRGSISTGKSIVCSGHKFNGTNIIIDGSSRNLLNDCSGVNFAYNGLVNGNDYVITRQKEGVIDSGVKSYKYHSFQPSSTTHTIQLPEFSFTGQQAIVELTGIGGKWTSQTGLFYKGLIQVVYVSASSIVARVHDIDNTLFSATPTVSVDATTRVMTITFEPASTTETYGILFEEIYWANLS